jgi:hypothetical protein
MIGFDGTASWFVYGIRFHCGRFEVSERAAADGSTELSVRLVPTTTSTMYGNFVVPTPPAYSAMCPGEDQVVTQIESEAARYDGNGPYIAAMRVTCSRAVLKRQGSGYQLELMPTGPLKIIGYSHGDLPKVLHSCGETGVITQFRGRAGAFIDSVAFACSELEFVAPGAWWKNPRALGGVSAALLVLLFAASAAWTRAANALLRWLPVVLAGTGGLGGALVNLVTVGIEIDRLVFFGTLAGTGFAAASLGLIDPRVFRRLVLAEPFRTLAPIMLRSASLRRTVFSAYVNRLERTLNASASEVRGAYFPLPVHFEGPADTRLMAAPSAHAADILRADSGSGTAEAAKVLIEAPGGRGKSMLLEFLLRRAIEDWRAGRSARIPILCEAQGRPWEQIISAALGGYALPDDVLAALLAEGDFILFADRLSESDARLADLTAFICSPGGTATAMVLASRPSSELRRALKQSATWCRLTPLPLEADSEALAALVRHYHSMDRCSASVDEVQSIVDSVCRGSDKLYAPILVRLTVRACASGEALVGIASVYEAAFKRLVSADTSEVSAPQQYFALRRRAVEFAVASYWHQGDRTGPFHGTPTELDALKAAGILVESRPRFGQPIGTTVHFFHDSMQSYFAAVGLAEVLESAQQSLADVLFWSAAAVEYRNHRSDLFGYTASELFCMLVHIAPIDAVEPILLTTLRAWGEKFDGKLARDDVSAVLPKTVAPVIANLPMVGLSGGAYLAAVLEQLGACPEEQRLSALAALYSRIAITAFEAAPPRKPELQAQDALRKVA